MKNASMLQIKVHLWVYLMTFLPVDLGCIIILRKQTYFEFIKTFLRFKNNFIGSKHLVKNMRLVGKIKFKKCYLYIYNIHIYFFGNLF